MSTLKAFFRIFKRVLVVLLLLFAPTLQSGYANDIDIKETLHKKDLIEFIEVIENKPFSKKVAKAKELFSVGERLPTDYRWVFKDYKVESYQGLIKYIFLNEEAFGNVTWKIEVHVQISTSSIVFFEAGASKEK